MTNFDKKKKEIAAKMDKRFAENPFAKKMKRISEERDTVRILNKK